MDYNFSDIQEILVTDFDWWSQVKWRIQKEDSKVLFKSGKIWWCKVGLNIGEEIFGKGLNLTRPVLVFKKLNSNLFMALPLTSKQKHGTWYIETTLNGIKRWAMLNQARILDRKRLTRRIGSLDAQNISEVRRRFVEFYSL